MYSLHKSLIINETTIKNYYLIFTLTTCSKNRSEKSTPPTRHTFQSDWSDCTNRSRWIGLPLITKQCHFNVLVIDFKKPQIRLKDNELSDETTLSIMLRKNRLQWNNPSTSPTDTRDDGLSALVSLLSNNNYSAAVRENPRSSSCFMFQTLEWIRRQLCER